jgi:hypothetical protein
MIQAAQAEANGSFKNSSLEVKVFQYFSFSFSCFMYESAVVGINWNNH